MFLQCGRCAHPGATASFQFCTIRSNKSSVDLSTNNFVKCGNPTLESALKQAKKDVNTPKLAQPIQYERPFAFCHNLYNGCLLDNGSFGWVKFTLLLGAGLRFPVGLNLQCIHPDRVGILKTHNNQRKLSAQYKQ